MAGSACNRLGCAVDRRTILSEAVLISNFLIMCPKVYKRQYKAVLYVVLVSINDSVYRLARIKTHYFRHFGPHQSRQHLL